MDLCPNQGLEDGMKVDLQNDYRKLGLSEGRYNQTAIDPASKKSEWIAPQLREFGDLYYVVKGISYNPLDGLANLTP